MPSRSEISFAEISFCSELKRDRMSIAFSIEAKGLPITISPEEVRMSANISHRMRINSNIGRINHTPYPKVNKKLGQICLLHSVKRRHHEDKQSCWSDTGRSAELKPKKEIERSTRML
jgi:hypothetical protein